MALLRELGAYSRFDPHIDQQGERNFGDLTLLGEDLLCKIDYYDNRLTYGSDCPTDPEKTRRVMTVLLVSDY